MFTGSGNIESHVDKSESKLSEVVEPDARLKWGEEQGCKEVDITIIESLSKMIHDFHH